MRLKPSIAAEQGQGGTRQRVIECRRRLRRTRVTLMALRVERDEAVVGARELLALVPGVAGAGDSVEIFEDAGAGAAAPDHNFAPEVDRRTRLRAR